MSTLYEIDANIRELLENGFNAECIDEETGEIDFEKGAALLEQYQCDRKTKLENIALYIKNLEAEADAIKNEEKTLKARREAKENKVDNLKTYLTDALKTANESKFETSKVVLSFRKSISVQFSDDAEIPKEYLVEKTTYTPDKTAIKKAILSGKEVSGAKLEEKHNLQIK